MSRGDRLEEGFLARWSERKLLERRGERAPESADERNASAGEATSGLPDTEPERALTDADMPPLDSLDGRSDYSCFLSRGVSESLRRQALSKLFRSAHLNVVDGLDDYAEDFTRFVPLGDIVTADMRYRVEQAAKRLLDEPDRTAPETAELEEGPERQSLARRAAADADDEPTEGEEA